MRNTYHYGKITFEDGYSFYPKSIKPIFDSLAAENSGRTVDGVMHIKGIKNRIRKLEITLPPMSGQEVYNILNRVQGKIYTLTYFDVLSNDWRTSQFYTSQSSTDAYSGIFYKGLWQGTSFNAIEIEGENS